MIKIRKSPTADTRTCDVTTVSKKQLLQSTAMHIDDVRKGMQFLIAELEAKCVTHDYTKIANIDEFYSDFRNNFQTTGWWDMHRKTERHHLQNPDGVPDDVNLMDVIECLVDGVMAGSARSGEYKHFPLTNEVLQLAYINTAKLLLANIEVYDIE